MLGVGYLGDTVDSNKSYAVMECCQDVVCICVQAFQQNCSAKVCTSEIRHFSIDKILGNPQFSLSCTTLGLFVAYCRLRGLAVRSSS